MDQMLQTLTPEAQAEWEAEQRKRQIAQAMMKQFGGGVNIQQPNTPLMGKISPLAMLAGIGTNFLTQKTDSDAAARQKKIQGDAAKSTSEGLESFFKNVQPGAMTPGTPATPFGSRDMPQQDAQQPAPVDRNSIIAQTLASQNPMLRSAAANWQKQQGERANQYATAVKDSAPQLAADAIRNQEIPADKLPAPMEPQFGSVPGPNGLIPTVTNTGRGGFKTGSFGPGAAPSATATVQNSPDYKDLVESRSKELEKKKLSATAAKDILSANMAAVQALEEGGRLGGTEGIKQAVRKVAQGFGLENAATAPTEQLSMALGEQILAHARKLAPVTGEDIKRLEAIKGSISTDPQALVRMLSITTAAAFKDTHDFNDYLSEQKKSISPMQTPAIRDQLQTLFAGQEIGYEAPTGLFGPQLFQLDTARNLINKGFDAKKLSGLPPQFLKDLAENPNMSINATGAFPGIAPKKAPPLDPSKLSPEQKKARIAELEALLRGN